MATQETRLELHELEQLTFEESDAFEVPPPDVISYNEMRSCADLFRMYREGILEISPGFQREIVWPVPAQTRFIDSLIKQLPIPTMCFSLDYKTQRWQVIDGLQRMWSIVRFLRGDEWHLSTLKDVDPSISGQHVPSFLQNAELHRYYTRVENLTLPITVIRCDYSKNSHMEYMFQIFHRLNTGAVKLNNQEIRNCIFSGTFNNFLGELAQDRTWLEINGRTSSTGDRYRGQEQILRFFAFRDEYKEYRGGLAAFLNEYMQKHREPGDNYLTANKEVFLQTIEVIVSKIGLVKGHRKKPWGISLLEAILVGVSLNLNNVQRLTQRRLRAKLRELLDSEEFSEEKLREGLSARPRVIGRLSTAERIFSGQ